VAAAERFEIGVIERLHPERDTIDAGLFEPAKPLRFDAGRIGFERDLRALRDRPEPAIASRMAPTVEGFIKDGVPPPKKIEETVRPCVNSARCASSAL